MATPVDEDDMLENELVEAQRQGLRLQEVPVTILERAGGETRKPRPLRYGARFASAMLRSWLR